jgi:hypothetical protein
MQKRLYDTNLHKLVTKEDPYHIHKLLGLCSLLNYIYRYSMLIVYGSMFLNTTLDMCLIGIHGCLPLSSILFRLPKKRHAKLPMIYPEFRLHSIAFGMRSIVCCFLDVYGGTYLVYYKMGVCFATMMAADWITAHYAEPGDTTMRAMPYDESMTEKDKCQITRFHSVQQMSATMYMLLNMDAAFSPLFAIQIGAFLMTLVRKSIIRPTMWHLLYMGSLIINIFVFYTMSLSQIIHVFIGTQTFLRLRIQLGMNKYIAWSIVFGIFQTLDLTWIDTYAYRHILVQYFMWVYICDSLYTCRSLFWVISSPEIQRTGSTADLVSG